MNSSTEFELEPGEPTSVAIREYLKGDGPVLDIDPRIDLTKPVLEQVVKLATHDKKAARKRQQKVA